MPERSRIDSGESGLPGTLIATCSLPTTTQPNEQVDDGGRHHCQHHDSEFEGHRERQSSR